MRKSLLILVLMMLLPYELSPAFGMPNITKEYKKANKLFASGNYQDALPVYKQVLEALPEDIPLSDIYTRLGDSYFNLGNYKNALEAYRGALRDQRRSERAATQYWIGFCTFLLGRYAEAEWELLKIPELYPASGMLVNTAYYWAGRSAERMGKRDKASQYYKKAGGNGKSTQGRFAMKRAEAAKGTSAEAQAPKPK